MKKQFFRVKQLADQTFLKADKSEVLNNEELHVADQKVEYLRTAITAINKRICHNQLCDTEKRMKKCLEYQLGSTFIEESRQEKDCQLFQNVLKESGRLEQDLAKDYAEHEMKVEEMVYGPLQKLLDIDFPNILKQKRNLSKYCLDKDSASNRYNNTKKETLKDDLEEADTKVEQSRDALAIEMFNLLARENELSTYILQFLKLQRGYHESALKNLENMIPELERKIGDSSVKRVFGIPLEEHLRVTGKMIAYPLEICITYLSAYGLTEEGLFRIGGGMSKVKRFKSSIDSGCFSVLIPEYQDVHVLASTLKLYLRELPDPLLTFNLHKDWMSCMQLPENQKLEIVKKILAKLPRENRDNLAYLFQFLAKLSQQPKAKMTPSNIAIVMAPNLLWDRNDEANINMGNCATANMIVEFFIKEVDKLFPGDASELVSKNILTGLLSGEQKNDMKTDSLNASSETINSILDSPKPHLRRKKPAAPVPPSNNQNLTKVEDIEINMSASYPSGSTTLNRPKKEATIKSNIGVNTDNSFNQQQEQKNANLVNNCDASEKTELFKTTAIHHVSNENHNNNPSNKSPRPIAAPRSINNNDNRVTRNSSLRNEMTKSFSSFEGDVQLRRPELVAKPEIPARPTSLQKRSSGDDVTLQRTHCSVYSVANKQQPSLVSLQKQLGHDMQMAEKEKFLGHNPDKTAPLPRLSMEKLTDNCNNVNNNTKSDIGEIQDKSEKTDRKPKPNVPPKSEFVRNSTKVSEKSIISRSNESLDEINEKLNGANRSSHTRTKSAGNIVDLGSDSSSANSTSHLQTPPSPRNLNKPTEPPPPPPVAVAFPTTKKDSTDL